MATPTHQAVRRWVMTGAVTAITVSGAIYGARLKMDREAYQETKRIREASPEEMIMQLELTKEDLLRRRGDLERKLEVFHKRKAEREEGK